MIEFGEPLHIYGLIVLGAIIIFMLGVMWGSLDDEPKKEQKNTD